MPDLNLNEGETEETSPEPTPSKKAKGGSALPTVLVAVVVVIILGAGVFMLNKLGIVKLWGKKQPVVATVEETPPALPESTAQRPTTQPQMSTAAKDTGEPTFLQTPGVETTPTPEASKSAEKKESKMDVGRGKKAEAPVKKESPPPRPSVTSSVSEMKGAYTVQVSAWRDKATAETMVQRLEEAGYPAFVEDLERKDGTWYAVRIGRYPSVSEARKAVENFALELKSHYVIDKVKIK